MRMERVLLLVLTVSDVLKAHVLTFLHVRLWELQSKEIPQMPNRSAFSIFNRCYSEDDAFSRRLLANFSLRSIP